MNRIGNLRRWVCAGASLLCLLVCLILSGSLSGKLESQQAAERWRGDSDRRFAQISCFLPMGSTVGEDAVLSFHTALDRKLQDAAVTEESEEPVRPVPSRPQNRPDQTDEAEESGEAALYTDAWSGEGELTLQGPRGTAAVPVLGVGGDWFFFHPLRLRSGSYISYDDLMHDRLVLDEALAWRLFGSMDVAGMTVTINNEPYQVAGVVAREDDFASEICYSGEAGAFLAYDTLARLNAVSGIQCYEIVLPDPISGFGLEAVESSFPVDGGEALENTGRYSLPRRLKLLADFGQRSTKTTPVVYPYWENAARIIEDYTALLLLLTLLFAVFPAIEVIRLAVWAVKWLGKYRGRPKAAVVRKIEKYREIRYEKEYQTREAQRAVKRRTMRRVQEEIRLREENGIAAPPEKQETLSAAETEQ